MIENYNDLTLGTFLEIDEVLHSDREDIDQQVAIIAILTGKTEEEILELPLTDYTALAAKTDFLRHDCPQVQAPARLIVGETAYALVKDFTKITTAQYVDFQTFSKQGTQKLPELLAVLLVPEGHKYNEGYDFLDVVADVKTLPLPVALSLVGFFFGALSESIADSLTYLEWKAKTLPRKKAKAMLAEAERFKSLLAGAGLQM